MKQKQRTIEYDDMTLVKAENDTLIFTNLEDMVILSRLPLGLKGKVIFIVNDKEETGI